MLNESVVTMASNVCESKRRWSSLLKPKTSEGSEKRKKGTKLVKKSERKTKFEKFSFGSEKERRNKPIDAKIVKELSLRIAESNLLSRKDVRMMEKTKGYIKGLFRKGDTSISESFKTLKTLARDR